jgi:peptidylprolyl isomerase
MSKEVSVRPIARATALFTAVLLASVALTGCASSADESCVNPLGSGNAASVTATGALGAAPTVDFPVPLVGKDSNTATIVAGNGAMVHDGNYVDFEATVLAGADKTLLTATAYGANGALPQRVGVIAGNNVLGDAFLCHRAGDRFALVGTIKDIFGSSTGNGIDATATAVIVFDVKAVYPHAASGQTQFGTDGLPAVTSAPDGQPGIAIPTSAAPTDLRVGTLIKGDGPVVSEGEPIVVQSLGVTWGKTVVENTWNDNHPKTIVVTSLVNNQGVGVVPGLAQALVGQTVGSRIVVAIPSSLGFPDGSQPQTIPTQSPLVYVIDILGVQQ